MGVYIIAEAGVNHNGSVETAKKLCSAAKKAGADAVKFQTWVTEKLITTKVKQAKYQRENLGNDESQFEMLKKLELSYEEFKEIKKFCDEIGIQFLSTADEIDSLNFLVDLGIPMIKVGSGEMGNIPYLRQIGSKGVPVIMSTGMSSLAEVEISIDALRQGGATEITLLHCTTNYPCPFNAVNLKAMDTLKNAFGLQVGYSDHTIGMEVPIAAVARGAVVIEKHFTLDRNMEGPDHKASMEPVPFKEMVAAIRNIESAIGSGVKCATSAEKEIAQVVLKKIVAKRYIKKGQKITEADICVKRNETGLPASAWDLVVGTEARRDYEIDEPIEL